MLTRPLAAVSTKAYFGVGRTREWVAAVARLAPLSAELDVELAVLPTFPLLESTAAALEGTGIGWGAQDVAATEDGAQTGEVLASVLADLGCRYVEVGHAERRSRFGESGAVVRAKAGAVVRAGMVPLVCVGEPDRMSPDAAAAFSIDQVLEAMADVPDAEVVVGYEPVWAIGAEEPAPVDHVVSVATQLRDALTRRAAAVRILYGGTAGPGLATRLGDAVDGLFLGRRAHDVGALEAVMHELSVARHADRPRG